MKKMLCLIAALALLLAGCGARPAPEETTADMTTVETQSQPQTEQTREEWAVLTPPLAYEIINGFAKTPTHYYAAHDGGIVRAPISDISRQEKIPLPDKYEGMKLSGAEICGITEEWLFVNRYTDFTGDDTPRTWVTYRIAMENWEAEAIASGKNWGALPWYNQASDSLLIPTSEGRANNEAMPLSTRKRTPIEGKLSGLEWRNTIDGRAALVPDEDSIYDDCYVVDANNQVQIVKTSDINLPKHWDWRKKEAPKNKAEEELFKLSREDGWINEYVTCEEYVYFILYDNGGPNFYRMKTDGTQRKLLREKTNIDYLISAGDKLLCSAYHPTIKNEWGCRQLDFYLLDENGKVVDVLYSYMEDDQGNVGYGLHSYGDKVIVMLGVIYCPTTFEFLYDPATGARFPAQKG